MPGSSSYFTQVLARRAYGSREAHPDSVLFELRGYLEHGPIDTAPDCVGDGVVALQEEMTWEHGTGLVPASQTIGWAVAPPPPRPASSFFGWIRANWILSWSHELGMLTLCYQASPTSVHFPGRVELRFHDLCRLVIAAEADKLDEFVRRMGGLLPAEPRPAGPRPPPRRTPWWLRSRSLRRLLGGG